MSGNHEEALARLSSYREKHFDLAKYVIEAYGGALYPLDLLIVASLNRSLCLLKGFIALIEARNFLAAAPLVRLQIDNCLRVSAGTLVDDPHEFALKVFEGVPVKQIKDRRGRKMTDNYLVKELSRAYPWVEKVYMETSGYIHLSEKHFYNAIQAEEHHHLNMKITDEDAYIPDGVYIEAIEAFKAATDLLFEYIYGWGFTKDNPEDAAKELARRRAD